MGAGGYAGRQQQGAGEGETKHRGENLQMHAANFSFLEQIKTTERDTRASFNALYSMRESRKHSIGYHMLKMYQLIVGGHPLRPISDICNELKRRELIVINWSRSNDPGLRAGNFLYS
jgi:hypothetical protein